MGHDNIQDIYKLSPIQQGLLYHNLYAPESAVYFEQFSWSAPGSLNIEAFERAWQHVVNRHPILRTSFFWEDLDEPLQLVHRRATLPIEHHDWSGCPPEELPQRLAEFLRADRQRGFELTEAPLMRLSITHLPDEQYQITWSYHHLLLDGWSVALTLEEVFASYEALRQGQTPRLPNRRPYRDYIQWLGRQDLFAAEDFWRETLRGFVAPTRLRIERESAAGEDYAVQVLYLSQAATTALQALARQHRVTLNILVQGAWALLLSRYSGDSDIVYGVTVAGRPTELTGFEGMIGVFINTLPVRVQLRPDQRLLDWLQDLNAQQVELRQYEYSPLGQIQGWSDVPRGTPLFESIVVFENYPVETFGRQGNAQVFQRTNYPLTIVAEPSAELRLRIGYEPQRYDHAAIERLLEQLRIMLEGMAEQLDRPLRDVDFLAEAERHTLLVEWNATAADYPQDACLHTLIEQQAQRTPDAVAVVFEAQQLTYAQLNARANQLAHHLRSLGVAPEQRVAVCLPRSADLLVGLLAILKAGGAYLPLDPAYPKSRLDFMLSDAAPVVVLTEARVADRLPATTAQVLVLDRAWPTIAACATSNPDAARA
ncbi:MAG TPA: condensation domain-containing protein, partial [Herpetosiphonaceae bacterium]